MAALSDATLLAISRISVGTPVTDDTDFTALTPAEVVAKFELSSYGGDEGSYVYAPGADGDYDALDPDDPPVTDLGLWSVGAFVNYAVNGLLTGAVAGSPGTMPTGWATLNITRTGITVGNYNGLPLLTIAGTSGAVDGPYETYMGFSVVEGDVTHASAFLAAASNVSATVQLRQVDNWSAATNQSFAINSEIAHVKTTRTAIAGATYRVCSAVMSNADIGSTLQFQIAGKQIVKNVGYHPPVLALSGAVTTTKLAAITQREVNVWKPFVVLIEATTGEDPGAHQVLYSMSRSADELVEIYRATSTHQITLKIRSGGVDYTKTLGSVADNTAFSVKLNVFASFTLASLNVGVAQVLTAPKPSGVLILESIGCKHDGTLQWGGPIAECNLIHPAVWTAAQLEAA